MGTLLLDAPTTEADVVEADRAEEPLPEMAAHDSDQWLVFRYATVGLFSLKASRATSTAGKTLLIPTPYAVKMAFLDAALRHALTKHPDELVRALAEAVVRIGVPHHTCVTGTIQTVRQETREIDRKRNPDLPPYRPNVALREIVHHQGTLRLAFNLPTCTADLTALLLEAAPAINYLGKRGGFIQYLGGSRESGLDSTYTFAADLRSDMPAWGHRTVLDDFGPKASFDALNSFSASEIKRGIHRKFIDTVIPLSLYNTGPGFSHYQVAGSGVD